MSSNDGLLGNDRFHHPFGNSFQEYKWQGIDVSLFEPRTVIELTMYSLSSTIRAKPQWWDKFRNETIRETWIKEIREQEKADELPVYRRLTDNMINYVFAELEDHAKMLEKSKIQMGPYDRIWLADGLIPDELCSSLVAVVKPLEDVPDAEKDWHPGSEGQVLDLVHPSICPLIYNRTFGKQDDQTYTVFTPDLDSEINSEFQSKRFQWLPSDFFVSEDRKVKLLSSYINNIHPKYHTKLADIIERVMEQAAIPLWERVLTDLRWIKRPSRLKQSSGEYNPECIWTEWQKNEEHGWSLYPYPPGHEEDDYDGNSSTDSDEWRMELTESMNLPDCPPYDGDLSKFFSSIPKVNLSGRTLQVIVKLANIILTPENPKYPGGKWHVEGMNNEHIVSTFIYYYDSDNIEDAELGFCQATSPPQTHVQDDHACMQVLYDMDNEYILMQEIGEVQTKKGRCLAFPNLYQHRLSAFELVDPTRPGHRKILVLFLVDPTNSIPSATIVPPQQLEIHQHLLRNHGPSSRLSRLPIELIDYIAYLTPGVMDRKEAEAIREELMQERTVFVEENDRKVFGHSFNMCEH